MIILKGTLLYSYFINKTNQFLIEMRMNHIINIRIINIEM